MDFPIEAYMDEKDEGFLERHLAEAPEARHA